MLLSAAYRRPPSALLKSRVSTSGMWSKAVLSFPEHDLAGDYVEPA